ncbi:putative leukotriene A-4 hydrolase/aminopeptidase [Dictyocaulus viviparus]|uniref:Putative leukotriene A-4 hydrolase/aminopeptidase n=1 Tax=Dictyocaulus viviparus TaxID=29172 RepID=A0A0D8XK86_DICVI|nr:putative leukotriene A-4 hydrolase/aminopeptidase [Dictyocaulus viviparus]
MYRDPTTSSNYEKIKVKHYSLFWNINFVEKRIVGSIVMILKALSVVDEVVLDGEELSISKIKVHGKEVKFSIRSGTPIGQAIVIETHITEGEEVTIEIEYSTASEASALQFMDRELTADKKASYLFSQCQAIHARSIMPCMDTPSVKSTYYAEVSVPSGMTCLMSAIAKHKKEVGTVTVYTFNQPIPIPSYLLAIVVGHLEHRDISERCAVWCEPSMVDSAKWEFEDTEKILRVAEDLVGPYRWGRYDLVVLPPTFPFGGMENPCLTFVTPTLLAGDRSLVNVVAHEIAHSWTGNLVTNASWEHFWLNEGFTVFLERKINGRLLGEPQRQFESECGFDECLKNAVKTFGDTHEFTKLIPNLHGVDPDDAFSSIPYEKGSALLFTLEQLIGDSARFEKFLRTYIDKYALQSVTTDCWKSELYSFFSDKKNILDNLDWNVWLFAPGVPPRPKYALQSVTTDCWKSELYSFFSDKKNILDNLDWNVWLFAPGVPPRPKYDSQLIEVCNRLASEWISAPESSLPGCSSLFENMSPKQKVATLEKIRVSGKCTATKMAALTTCFNLENVRNCEVKFGWLMLGLDVKWLPIIPKALSFVSVVGRMKFCKPIYRSLFNWPDARTLAVEQFERNRKTMHPITANTIAKMLKL